MRSILLILGVILLIAWVFGFVVYHVASGLIHILIVLAVVSFIFGGLNKGNRA